MTISASQVIHSSKLSNMGVTEFSYFTIKPGKKSADDGGLFERVLDLAVSQPGAGSIYYGNSIEKPDQSWCFLDWDSVEEHLAYRDSADHAPIGKALEPYLDWTKGYIKHITPAPWPPTILAEAPVVEVLTLFFPADLDDAAKASLTAQLEEFKTKALDTSPDFRGISHGWSVENDVPVTDEPGKTGNLLAAFIGWPSVDAHERFRDTLPFKENIGILRGMKDIVKLAVFHVSCKSKQPPKKD
ncbi:hypothetical protein CORC01_13405 [Colletotrichum orchidophilum]|uniref:ABM domain-containing protein n=1 Tax=Colletotrichum orchidophilum TaxID=1209926 RepID=A0A1G4AQ42_9PEZI|nr:uncharacterized protein CORC01_13405 [Colletotrichum orchidophilum]OHE91290.1 hypothetical protein CORC01_13405 [Colletotrichum orchidophilum]